MMPRRPWPRIVRGRTIVTSSPAPGGVVAEQLGLELRPPVRLERVRRASSRRPGSTRGCRRSRSTTCARPCATPGVARREEHVRGADDVHRPEQVAVAGERHLGDVVEHDVDAVARARARVAVAHVAGDELHARGARAGGFRSKTRTSSPRASACVGEDRAEVAAAAGDEDTFGHAPGHLEASPRSRHQRMLARMPSSKVVCRLVPDLRAGPRRCRTRSCPSARRARATAARSARDPGGTRRPPRRPRRRGAGSRTARFETVRPSASRASRTVASTSRSSYGSASAIQYALPAAAADASARSSPSHEVAGVHHRPLLRAVADEREAAPPDRGEELRLPVGLVRAVEPRRADDDGREVAAVVAALHDLLRLHLRLPVRHVGVERRVLGEAVAGVGFAPNGEFDDTCTKRDAPARRARSSTSWVPPTLTSKNSRVRPAGWITAAVWNTVAVPTPSNSASRADGSRTSPTTASTFGPTTSTRAASSFSCTRHRTRERCGASARTRFWPSQPAAPVTTTSVLVATSSTNSRWVTWSQGSGRRCEGRWP